MGCKFDGCKWVFKTKKNIDGSIFKFKARIVARKINQKERLDYFDTYIQYTRILTIRLLLALASIHNLMIHQMNVKMVFLYG